MATAAELLASSQGVDDTTLVIDNYFRTISIPKRITNIGVESDDDVLRLNFKMPRYLDDTDLSNFSIRINYLNAEGEGDAYTVGDKTVTNDSIMFSWLVGPHATAYAGSVHFNVCMKIVDGNGYIQREYNTTVATLPVLEGLETDERIISEYTDILEQWKRELFGIGDTEEASMRAVSQEEQENIAEKGREVLATIPEDYQTTYQRAEEGVRTKADAIVKTAEGTAIEVNDSSDDHVRNIRIFGKTSQFTTTGKNLLPPPNDSHFGTRNGVTFTRLDDGRIGVVGTASANTTLVFRSFSPGERTLIPAGTYTVSGSPGASVYLSFFIYENQETEEILMSNASLAHGNTWTFTLQTDAYYGAYLYIGSGKGPNEIVSPQLERGSVATAFEVYSGGDVSPRPDWPQPLNSVGDSGSVDVWMTSKNLLRDVDFPVTSMSHKISCDYEGNGTFHIHGTFASTEYRGIELAAVILDIPMDPDSKYTICARVVSGQPPDNFHPYLGAGSDTVNVSNWLATKIDPKSVIGQVYSNTATGRSAIKDANKIKRFWIYSYNDDMTEYTADFRIQVWLVKGDTPLEFEPYSESITTVSTPLYLRGIPVASDNGNYVDPNGQRWICDEIDFDRGVYIKRVNTRVITGEELFGDYIEPNGAITTSLWHKPDTKFLCTHAVQWREMTWANDEYVSFKVDSFNVSSVSELTERLIAWNESGNPLTVMYALREPTEIPLTTEELTAFKEMQTKYPNTMVFNNVMAPMELTYNADTKTYVDNEIKQSLTDVLEAIENGSY